MFLFADTDRSVVGRFQTSCLIRLTSLVIDTGTINLSNSPYQICNRLTNMRWPGQYTNKSRRAQIHKHVHVHTGKLVTFVCTKNYTVVFVKNKRTIFQFTTQFPLVQALRPDPHGPSDLFHLFSGMLSHNLFTGHLDGRHVLCHMGHFCLCSSMPPDRVAKSHFSLVH